MITKDQALTENDFHFGTCAETIGPRGGKTIQQTRARRNGKTQVWKTRPNDFRVPIKHGLYAYGEITQQNADQFHTAKDCPLNQSEVTYTPHPIDGRTIGYDPH